MAPVIIGSLGSIPEGLKDQLQTLQIYHANLIPKMQKSVLLSSCHILRRFVTEHYNPNLLAKVWDITYFLHLVVIPALLCVYLIIIYSTQKLIGK